MTGLRLTKNEFQTNRKNSESVNESHTLGTCGGGSLSFSSMYLAFHRSAAARAASQMLRWDPWGRSSAVKDPTKCQKDLGNTQQQQQQQQHDVTKTTVKAASLKQ